MTIFDLKGLKVENTIGGVKRVGTILNIDKTIAVDFGGEARNFSLTAIETGALVMIDPTVNVSEAINVLKQQQAIIAAAKAQAAAVQAGNHAGGQRQNNGANMRQTPIQAALANLSKLEKGISYGANSREIYKACCNAFGWARRGENCFGWQTPMYAGGVTREGYDVWFVSHSNWTDHAGNGWINTISNDWKTIKEKYPEAIDPSSYKNKRVVFAKTQKGDYIFLGVYNVSHDQLSQTHIFELVSDVYQ